MILNCTDMYTVLFHAHDKRNRHTLTQGMHAGKLAHVSTHYVYIFG